MLLPGDRVGTVESSPRRDAVLGGASPSRLCREENLSKSGSEAQVRRKRRVKRNVVRKSWVVALPRCISVAKVVSCMQHTLCAPKKQPKFWPGPARWWSTGRAPGSYHSPSRVTENYSGFDAKATPPAHPEASVGRQVQPSHTINPNPVSRRFGGLAGDFQSAIHQKPLPHIGAAPVPVASTIEAHDKGSIERRRPARSQHRQPWTSPSLSSP